MNHLTQCYWHANGQLECKTIQPKKLSNEFIEFNTFSNPNINYKPNAYHDNYNYYQQSNKYYCLNQKSDLPGKNNYIAPPKTYKRVNYLDGDTGN